MSAGNGRLRIFLGASPGVGKTFAMLEEGHRLQDDGINTVDGFVEDHGRRETRALIAGLELIPRLQINYGGVMVEEMDVDAILRRHPDVVLVDELAHTNAPGSTRSKRWQDVEHLLDAGIDVITTLNIQHIEELTDVVEDITGVAVRETVPDRLIDQADEIHLVDLPSNALIERMEDGKIYPPAQATKALENFFTVGNLSALRELALRRTADGVNDRLADLMVEGAIGLPETHDCVAVMLDASPRWGTVLRKAWRLASAFHSPLVVVHEELPERGSDRLRANLQLAEDLGAQPLVIPQQDGLDNTIPKELVQELRRIRCTMLVLGVHTELGGTWPFRTPTLREARLITSLANHLAPRMDIVLVPDHVD